MLLCGSGSLSAAELQEAWSCYWRGRYEEAEERFAAALEDDAAASLGLARTLAARGRLEEADRRLVAGMERFPRAAALPAERARLAFERGDYERAGEWSKGALAVDGNQPLARWLTAELHRVAGRIPEAEKGYAWFIDHHNRNRELDLESLYWVGQAAAQYARWRRNSSQFNFLVNRHYPKLVEQEADYWPALLAAGRLFLEKYNEPTALKKIEEAAAINAESPEVLAARAELALQKFEVDRAAAAVERALAVNPRHLPSWRLKADVAFADLRSDLALESLAEARRLHPLHEETLGRAAAAYLSLDGPSTAPETRLGALQREVMERNPRCGGFFLAMGEALERMRKFPQAAEAYRSALERMPELIEVRGKLGLCLMRLGEEVEAAALLEESFRIDPFNVRVRNMLQVLDVLHDYALLETEHFILRFDRGQDGVLMEYAARLLEEEIYPQVTEALGHEPEGKTLIQVFSRAKSTSGHGWFSARMVGLPFIGTVGACAGRVVALASPGDLPQPYNWSRVLRHEFVHVVNLQQTDFNIPHWFTEGLAVWHEGLERPAAWNRILAARAAAGELFTLETINYGFLRPRTRDDWNLAYCQAELYVEYMLATHGEGAPARLLAALREEPAAPAAIRKAFEVNPEEFETGYREFVGRIVAEAPRVASPTSGYSFAELQEQVRESPERAELRAELADQLFRRGDRGAARREAAAALELEPKQPLAACVLARLHAAEGKAEEAVRLLEGVFDPAAPHSEALGALAALRRQAGDTEEAIRLFRLGSEKFPGDDNWLKALGQLFLSAGDGERLEPVLRELARRDADALLHRRKLVELAALRRDQEEVARWGEEVLRIQVRDAPVHALRAAALAQLGKPEEAERHFRTAIELDGRSPVSRATYARLLIELGKTEAAREQVEWLREHAPEFPTLPELQERLP